MSACLFLCLAVICLSVCWFGCYLFVCLSVCLFVCLFGVICLCVCLFVGLAVICLSVSRALFLYDYFSSFSIFCFSSCLSASPYSSLFYDCMSKKSWPILYSNLRHKNRSRLPWTYSILFQLSANAEEQNWTLLNLLIGKILYVADVSITCLACLKALSKCIQVIWGMS